MRKMADLQGCSSPQWGARLHGGCQQAGVTGGLHNVREHTSVRAAASCRPTCSIAATPAEVVPQSSRRRAGLLSMPSSDTGPFSLRAVRRPSADSARSCAADPAPPSLAQAPHSSRRRSRKSPARRRTCA